MIDVVILFFLLGIAQTFLAFAVLRRRFSLPDARQPRTTAR